MITPEKFDAIRAKFLSAQHALYSAVFSTQHGELPSDLEAYKLKVGEAYQAHTEALAELDWTIEGYEKA